VDDATQETAIQEIEQDDCVIDVDPGQEVMATNYEIASYGADYPVDGLVKRLVNKDIVIPSFDPTFEGGQDVQGFQRKFVWTRPQMDKFVESLLLGLPVPGVFLVRDRDNKLLVLDGQQRLKTLQAYYKGSHGGQVYKLKNVQSPYVGKAYEDLDDEDRRRLDDSIIHATVLRQEHPAGSQDAVYSIFERLNTGGSPLQPQEIRVALYHGPFLQALSHLNEDTNWRDLYGPASSRLKDHELILRVLALFENGASYSRPVKGFLNHYLEANVNRTDTDRLFSLFAEASKVVNVSMGKTAFRPVRTLNAAVLDAIMVGLMRRLEAGPVTDLGAFKKAYESLASKQEFIAVTGASTASEEAVTSRISLAAAAFEDIA